MKNRKRGMFSVVLIVFFFLLIFSFSSLAADAEGCYYYPEASSDVYCKSVLNSVAQADCDGDSECDSDLALQNYFISAADCLEIAECGLVTCAMDNECQEIELGLCESQDGVQVLDENFASECTPGCCAVADKFCGIDLIRSACSSQAQKLGFQSFSFDTQGLSLQKCQELYCHVEVKKASIEITVTDSEGKPISGASVTLGETTKETTNGKVKLEDISPGDTVIDVTSSGYNPKSLTISLIPGENNPLTIILNPETAKATLTIAVKGVEDKDKVVISWEGEGQKGGPEETDTGTLDIPDLPLGRYTITVSAFGYGAVLRTIDLKEDKTETFTLEKQKTLTISGTVQLEDKEGVQKPFSGVKIYLDGKFKGYSKIKEGLEGQYEIKVSAAGNYQISASYPEYQFEPIPITVPEEGETIQDLILTPLKGECTDEFKEVQDFSVIQVPGEASLQLSWNKPCQEVRKYRLKITDDQEISREKTFSPAVHSYKDEGLDWERTYSYEIVAIYLDAGGNEQSSPAISTELTDPGQEECEGRYDSEQDWETFCRYGELNVVKTCTNQNLFADPDYKTCPTDQDWYCAPIGPRNADCKEVGPCKESGWPFGLFYTKEQCYGNKNPQEGKAINFCYFDYSSSIVEQCSACYEINNCFDYKSKDACEVNSCFNQDPGCRWVDSASTDIVNYKNLQKSLGKIPSKFVTKETGSGYCVENDYQEQDTCSLCSSSAHLFENYYCTAEVCTALGACFSEPSLSECLECGQYSELGTTCYDYATKLECISSQSSKTDSLGRRTYSKDSCNWQTCNWNGPSKKFSKGGCFKDGDGDGKDDCGGVEISQLSVCQKDNVPPKTTLVSSGTISLNTPNVILKGDSQHEETSQANSLQSLYYCLTSADPNSPDDCTEFSKVDYERGQFGTLTINILEDLQKAIDGQDYKLKYYSKDEFNNQEDVQEAILFIDNVAPEFEIKYEQETDIDTSKLSVYLEGLTSGAECEFTLIPVLGQGTEEKVKKPFAEDKSHVFENLLGVHYQMQVACIDKWGNEGQESEEIIFDLEPGIILRFPTLNSLVAQTEISFQVETLVGSTCGLYKAATNEFVADFNTDEEGKVHQTAVISGFIEKEYAAEFKVVCEEFFSGEKIEKPLHFTIDFTPPATKVTLEEGSRIVTPVGDFWEEFFVKSANVELTCDPKGFECDQIYYCQGDGCESKDLAEFQIYSDKFNVNETSQVCYYSTDAQKNPVYLPTCGQVVISGYGLHLENPPHYTFNNQIWGVSYEPNFELIFTTLVPTTECRVDFTSGFEYENVPAVKILQNQQGKYHVEDFPQSLFSSFPEGGGTKVVYVKCLNVEGELSDEMQMYLTYDPQAPAILEAYAQPKIVYEGVATNLYAKTDDPTICRYSDNSEGQGSSDYSTMEFFFPGLENDVLHVEHLDSFYINFVSENGKKDYSLNLQCMNGAHNLSQLETIDFQVDYAALGFISSVWPQGDYLSDIKVEIKVQTSKSGQCSYEIDEYLPMASNGGIEHSTTLTNLAEKEYRVPVKCQMGGHETFADPPVTFTIDRTKPVIETISDGNYSCGSDLHLLAYTNEESISGYIYEVYDAGDASTEVNKTLEKFEQKTQSSSFSRSSSRFTRAAVSSRSSATNNKKLIFNGSAGPDLPIKVPTSQLEFNHKYLVKIKAIDAAGNVGEYSESDGSIYLPSDNLICKDSSPPTVIIAKKNSSSCSSESVEILCEDEMGCQVQYGMSRNEDDCQANKSYSGTALKFEKSSWLCYQVQDSLSNSQEGSKRITVADKDGDGVIDSCDLCPKTNAGEVAGSNGCAWGKEPEDKDPNDTDGDGLPDYWERLYDSAGCELDMNKVDSNDDGTSDKYEDYDHDGHTNYEEYRSLQTRDPCVADGQLEPPVKPPGEVPIVPPGVSPGDLLDDDQQSNTLAWILLILGLLLTLGGIGYLVYYYKYSPAGKTITPKSSVKGPSKPLSTARQEEQTKPMSAWKRKFLALRNLRRKKSRQDERKSLFKGFAPTSAKIPHVDKFLGSKGVQLPKLHKIAHTYNEHKDEIKPGLRREEKSIFNKLESIAKKTKDKDIEEVVDKKEAQDIFAKLKKLSKERKK